jgi:hypothetical protein
MSGSQAAANPIACVEKGLWTPVPRAAPGDLTAYTLKLGDLDPDAHQAVVAAGALTFHLVGCSGDSADPDALNALAAAMAAQAHAPGTLGTSLRGAQPAAFLFHLGDITYKPDKPTTGTGKVDKDQDDLYQQQFFAPFASYPRRIVAIAGNHDGKDAGHDKHSAIQHFLATFCAPTGSAARGSGATQRPPVPQPYVYWRLTTPFAYVIGLYANIANGGVLDDPNDPAHTPQYDWLVAQLRDVKARNEKNTPQKAVLLAVHYPPYSGAANFLQRGDPALVRTEAGEAVPHTAPAAPPPLAARLEQAFAESGQFPDLVVSAHAHLYQRLTSQYTDGRQVPYLIAGSGGHMEVENMWALCAGGTGTSRELPFDAVLPHGLSLLPGQRVQVVSYWDATRGGDYGFLRLTITPGPPRMLHGEFFTAYPNPLALRDAFELDLETHRVTDMAPS